MFMSNGYLKGFALANNGSKLSTGNKTTLEREASSRSFCESVLWVSEDD